jgi:hypothetical protein
MTCMLTTPSRWISAVTLHVHGGWFNDWMVRQEPCAYVSDVTVAYPRRAFIVRKVAVGAQLFSADFDGSRLH